MSHEFWKRIAAYWKHTNTLEAKKEREKKVKEVLKETFNKPFEVRSIKNELDEDDLEEDDDI